MHVRVESIRMRGTDWFCQVSGPHPLPVKAQPTVGVDPGDHLATPTPAPDLMPNDQAQDVPMNGQASRRTGAQTS